MVRSCGVFGCTNRADYDRDRQFYRLPGLHIHASEVKKKLCLQRRVAWLSKLRLDYSNKKLSNVRVCSDHFISKQPSSWDDVSNPDWVPSLNMGYDKMENWKDTMKKRVHKIPFFRPVDVTTVAPVPAKKKKSKTGRQVKASANRDVSTPNNYVEELNHLAEEANNSAEHAALDAFYMFALQDLNTVIKTEPIDIAADGEDTRSCSPLLTNENYKTEELPLDFKNLAATINGTSTELCNNEEMTASEMMIQKICSREYTQLKLVLQNLFALVMSCPMDLLSQRVAMLEKLENAWNSGADVDVRSLPCTSRPSQYPVSQPQNLVTGIVLGKRSSAPLPVTNIASNNAATTASKVVTGTPSSVTTRTLSNVTTTAPVSVIRRVRVDVNGQQRTCVVLGSNAIVDASVSGTNENAQKPTSTVAGSLNGVTKVLPVNHSAIAASLSPTRRSVSVQKLNTPGCGGPDEVHYVSDKNLPATVTDKLAQRSTTATNFCWNAMLQLRVPRLVKKQIRKRPARVKKSSKLDLQLKALKMLDPSHVDTGDEDKEDASTDFASSTSPFSVLPSDVPLTSVAGVPEALGGNLVTWQCGRATCKKLFTSQRDKFEHDKLVHARKHLMDVVPKAVTETLNQVRVVSDAEYEEMMKKQSVKPRAVPEHPASGSASEHDKTETRCCYVCGRLFHSITYYRDHIKEHEGELNYECTACGEKFAYKAKLRLHLKSHAGKTMEHVCEQCGQAFSNRYVLWSHRAKQHGEELPYKCTYCGQGFARSYNLKMHMATHTGIRKFQCEMCDKTLSTNQARQNHLLLHHKKKLLSGVDVKGSFQASPLPAVHDAEIN